MLQQEVAALGGNVDEAHASVLEAVQRLLQEDETDTALDQLSAFRDRLEGEALAPEARQRASFLTDALTNALR